jgi:hypothetical protein
MDPRKNVRKNENPNLNKTTTTFHSESANRSDQQKSILTNKPRQQPKTPPTQTRNGNKGFDHSAENFHQSTETPRPHKTSNMKIDRKTKNTFLRRTESTGQRTQSRFGQRKKDFLAGKLRRQAERSSKERKKPSITVFSKNLRKGSEQPRDVW